MRKGNKTMKYIEAVLTETYANFKVSMDNENNIHIREYDYDGNTTKQAHREYETREQAISVFMKMSECVLNHTHDFDGRVAILG